MENHNPSEASDSDGCEHPKPTEAASASPGPTASCKTFPTTLADLRFHSNLEADGSTSQKSSIYTAIKGLRKSTLSIPNRLKSVLRDAEFVTALWEYLRQECAVDETKLATNETSGSTGGNNSWPLIPNERSGSWALDPDVKARSQQGLGGVINNGPVSAYFKSTDGHINQWAFSTRRLNLPVLEVLGSAKAAMVIDTTRRGKSFPDALRRTVPIWCAVWNHVLFPELVGEGICDFQDFRLDPSEVAQIKARIPRFVDEVKRLGLDLRDLGEKTKRPTACVWLNQPATEHQWLDGFRETADRILIERLRWRELGGVNILVCCSASKQVIGTEMSEDGYIQGAGDDSESWSHGLTAKLFWENKDDLIAAIGAGDDAEMLVEKIVQESKRRLLAGTAIPILPTESLFLCSGSTENQHYDLVIDCNRHVEGEMLPKNILQLGLKDGKSGSKQLRDKFSEVQVAAEQVLKQKKDATICVHCSTGRDLSVGVVLVLLCTLYADSGKHNFHHQSKDLSGDCTRMSDTARDQTIDKQFIKQRLAWITSSKPDANPSRATLQAVNSFLMGRPS